MTIRTLTLAAVVLATIAATPPDRTYTVRKGDTLHRIAKRLGVTPAALAEANGLASAHRLQRGQVLKVPTSTPSAAPAVKSEAEVAIQQAPLYAGMSAGSRNLGTLPRGTTATVIREADAWTKLQLSNGVTGWISTGVLKVGMPVPFAAQVPAKGNSPRPVAAKPTPAKRKRGAEAPFDTSAIASSSLLRRAFSYRGVRYRYGGTSRSGIDCSGFTSSVFRGEGVQLPRTAIQQSRVGQYVSRDELSPGDLVFFRTNRSVRVNHVGIYVGNGKFLHAATSGGRVRLDELSQSYYSKRFAGGRRVAKVAPNRKGGGSMDEVVAGASR